MIFLKTGWIIPTMQCRHFLLTFLLLWGKFSEVKACLHKAVKGILKIMFRQKTKCDDLDVSITKQVCIPGCVQPASVATVKRMTD